MDKFTKLSKKYNIPVLEDCAQAHGSEFKGQRVGGIGEAGAFSFFATKHMTTGEGGMITTNHKHIAETARIIRNHGMRGRDDHVLLGYNNRMTEIEAAMGLVQLQKLDSLNQRRVANSEYLLSHIRQLPWAEVPVVSHETIKHTYFWCPVLINEDSNRDIEDLKAHLKKHRIGFRQRYRAPLYKQSILTSIGLDYSKVYLENVEKVAGNIIGLPNHPKLTQKQMERIIVVLNQF
jgi:perosamine synthetase